MKRQVTRKSASIIVNGFLRNTSALVGMTIVLLGPIHAQAPPLTTTTYNDWTVSCAVAAGTKSCEMSQTQLPPGQPNPISQITIGRVARNEPLKIAIQVAPNLWLQAGVRLVIDEKEALLAAPFRWCVPSRCLADADLTDAVIKKLAGRTEPARLIWKDAAQRDITIAVSLKGFSPALNAMNDAPASGPVAAEAVRRFDGQWLLEAECEAISPNTQKAAWKTTGKIVNGKLSAKFGEEGRSGSGEFEGLIESNGHLDLFVKGLTGESKYTNLPEKTPYTWKAIGSLSRTDGKAAKIDGRFCVVNFTKTG